MIITEHAYEQARLRFSLSRKAFCRLAARAYQLGVSRSEATGNLRNYMDRKYLGAERADNLRFYGEILYVFCGQILVTVYRVPSDCRPKRRENDKKNARINARRA